MDEAAITGVQAHVIGTLAANPEKKKISWQRIFDRSQTFILSTGTHGQVKTGPIVYVAHQAGTIKAGPACTAVPIRNSEEFPGIRYDLLAQFFMGLAGSFC